MIPSPAKHQTKTTQQQVHSHLKKVDVSRFRVVLIEAIQELNSVAVNKHSQNTPRSIKQWMKELPKLVPVPPPWKYLEINGTARTWQGPEYKVLRRGLKKKQAGFKIMQSAIERYLRGCLFKNRPLILLRKFEFSQKLGFRSPYLVNHQNEFYLFKNSNWIFLGLIEVRSARHKLRIPAETGKIAHIAGALKQKNNIRSKVSILGVILDKELSLKQHVNDICKKAILAIQSISRMRKYLSHDNLKCIVNAFVISRLDYCNSILYIGRENMYIRSKILFFLCYETLEWPTFLYQTVWEHSDSLKRTLKHFFFAIVFNLVIDFNNCIF